MTRCAAAHHHFLAHGFSGFLRRRRTLKHIGRQPLLDTLAGRGPTQPAPEHLARELLLLITASVPGTAAWRQCQICFVLRMLTRINPGRHIGATIDAMNRLTPALQAPRTERMDAKRVDSSAAPCV